MSGEHGTRVEEEVRSIASDLGVADFVFTSALVSKGGATRELGDGLLIVGSLGAIVQVKARDPERIVDDTPEAANRWAARHIKKADAQVHGSRREIERRLKLGDNLVAVPKRVQHLSPQESGAYALPIGGTVAAWPGIIVIDHPTADLDVDSECLVLSKGDWLELYHLMAR